MCFYAANSTRAVSDSTSTRYNHFNDKCTSSLLFFPFIRIYKNNMTLWRTRFCVFLCLAFLRRPKIWWYLEIQGTVNLCVFNVNITTLKAIFHSVMEKSPLNHIFIQCFAANQSFPSTYGIPFQQSVSASYSDQMMFNTATANNLLMTSSSSITTQPQFNHYGGSSVLNSGTFIQIG